MEQWIREAIKFGAAAVAVLSVSLWRLKVLDDKMEKHMSNDNKSPHSTCLVEGQTIGNIHTTLKSIDTKVSQLDDRFYKYLIKNGYPVDKERR